MTSSGTTDRMTRLLALFGLNVVIAILVFGILDRGVFVRVLTVQDVEDIYRTRRLVECAVVRGLGEPPFAVDAVTAAVDSGLRAAREGDWKGVSTANIHFHRDLVALAGSARVDELMRSVFAELRLAFHVVDDPKRLHEPYLARNRQILQALEAGDRAEAEKLLAVYLEDSLERVVEVYRRRVGEEA